MKNPDSGGTCEASSRTEKVYFHSDEAVPGKGPRVLLPGKVATPVALMLVKATSQAERVALMAGSLPGRPLAIRGARS